jgi:autotransporter-associated beta strand protein
LSISNIIGNSGTAKSLTVSGAGVLALSGNNTYGPSAGTVGTTLNGGGTLQAGNNNAVGAGDLSVSGSGGTIRASTAISLANNIALGAGGTLDNNGNSVILTGTVSGAGGLTKIGNGVLTLSGANTYSGGTINDAGVLSLGSTNAIGTGTLTLNGGNLDSSAANLVNSNNNAQTWNNNFTFIGSQSLNLGTGAVAMNSNCTVTISANTLTVGGLISGAGSLTKAGSGVLVLSGANTYAGDTTVSVGTLSLGGNSPLPSGSGKGNVIVNGTLELNGHSTSINGLSGSGIVDNTGAANSTLGLGLINATSTFSGAIQNSGSFVINIQKSGLGTLTLAGTNTFSGDVQVSGFGVLSVSSIGHALGNVSSIKLGSGGSDGTLRYTGTGETSDRTISYIANSGGNSVIDQSGTGLLKFTADFSSSGTAVHSVVLQGSGAGEIAGSIPAGTATTSLAKGGAGTWTLSGNNGYAGNTTVSNGTLVVGGAGTLGGGLYTGNIINKGTFNFASSSSQSLFGVISGTGSLIQSGTNVLTLYGINTYTGNTTVSAGTLAVEQASLATNSTVSISNGAVLQLDFATTNQVAALVLNGVTQPNGVYGSSTPGGYIAGTGFLQVAPVGPTGPANLTNSVSGNQLSLSWPSGQGWKLQIQTNSLSTGLGTNWTYITDGSVTSTNITIVPTLPSVFFRLVYP